MRNRILLPCLLLVTLRLAACGDEPGPRTGREACSQTVSSPHALWSEFLDPEEVLGQIPLLRSHSISLYQNIRSEQIGDPATHAFLTQATCTGIEVRAWLTLPQEEGYWPNEKNADLFSEKALELARWIRSSGWPVDWIVVDMETDFQTATRLQELLKSGDIPGAVELFAQNRDPQAYESAREKFAAMVDSLHAMGFNVMAVTLPMVLDDLFDGDPLIQDLMNIPVDGIPWDEVSFMAYTTIFGQMLGVELGPDLVYSYGRDAVLFYGDRAAVDIGVIGDVGIAVEEGITDVREMTAQVGAAREAGLAGIHAYSLDGILALGDPSPWYEAFQAPPAPVAQEDAVTFFRGMLQLLDRLL